jgi:hypothetical protein
MAGYNSDLHDPLDDLICDYESGKKRLNLDELHRLLVILQNLMDRANNDPSNKLGFFKSQLECNQAKCNIVQIIRVKALVLEAHGTDSTAYVIGCFSQEAKDEALKKVLAESKKPA